MTFAAPARRIAVLPIQRLASMRQQWLEPLEHLPCVQEKLF